MSAVEVPEMIDIDIDDKNAKVLKQTSNFLSCGTTQSCLPAMGPVRGKRIKDFLCNPLKMYTCYLTFTVIEYIYSCEGPPPPEDLIGYVSCVLEAYGLISVFQKIQQHRTVKGISGMSLIMFALSYVLREAEVWVMSSRFHLTKRGIALEFLQSASIPLIFSLLWSVFKTHKDSYQESLDVLKVKYLFPGCVMLAFVLQPQFRQGKLYSYCWSTSFYVDVLALLPQVVMMARNPAKKVAVPIANFVAATAFSRSVDLGFWYYRFDLGPQGWWGNFNYSGWLIVFFHVVSLLLIVDFMYYYVRARLAARLGEDKQAMSDEARGMMSIDGLVEV